MKRIVHLPLCVMIVLGVVLAAPSSWSATGSEYSEDFLTKQNCDTLNTTADWDTLSGELKLWPFSISLFARYQTDMTGSAHEIVSAGDYAYIASMSGLEIVDISDPAHPALAGTYAAGQCVDVEVHGNYAYLAAWGDGLMVIDITSPTSPVFVGQWDAPARAEGLTISGDYAYVAEGHLGLRVIDISTPSNPVVVATYDTPDWDNDVTVSGDYAFVAANSLGLRVFDISNPVSPSLVGSAGTSGNASCVEISGDYAYVGATHNFTVIDISDPTNPIQVDNEDSWFAEGIAITGDYAYVPREGNGFNVFDISDPTNVSQLTYFSRYYEDGPITWNDVALAGEYVYLCSHDTLMDVLDIMDMFDPVLVASLDTPGKAWETAIAGDYAFVADGNSNELQVIDISDPTSSFIETSFDSLTNEPLGIDIEGNYVYLAMGSAGLRTIDISDPTQPWLGDIYNTIGRSNDVDVEGNYAYVADHNFGVQVINVSDPRNITFAGSYNTPGLAYALVVDGDYLLVADGSAGLRMIDITTPASPSEIGSYNTSGDAIGIAVDGDNVYLAGGSAGLQVIDVTNPTAPSLIGSYDTDGVAYDVVVYGNYAYMADYSDGVYVFDVSDPTDPVLAWQYDTSGNAFSAIVEGDYLFVSDDTEGLKVLKIFERRLDLNRNIGQSLALNQTTKTIASVRLNATQTDTIRWEVSADNGGNWQDISPDWTWNLISNPGSDLIWRSTHVYEPVLGVNPTCTDLMLEWYYDAAVIDSIMDVPADQGKVATIHWTRSGFDYMGSPMLIEEYEIYRKIDPDLASLPIVPMDANGGIKARRPSLYPPGSWYFIISIAADGSETYSTIVPTLKDSTIVEGMYHTTFFIRARTETPGAYYDCDPDSGYTVDNLAPQSPEGFTAVYNTGSGNNLTWESCPDADFQYFNIYRGTSSDFTPAPGNLEHQTTDTTWVDTVPDGYQYYYKITAVDYSGNESDPSSPETVTNIERKQIPKQFALYQNVPNPFNPSTMIKYSTASSGRITLRIYDAAGRLVDVLADEWKSSGEYEVTWTGCDMNDTPVASGVYFIRLRSGEQTQTRKMILMK
jgi:hypothetical protein